jgi:protein-tyrosine phosphatase
MGSRTMVDTVTEPHWIALEGAANVRDVGGLPTTEGRLVKQHQLIRADNLQDLSMVDSTHSLWTR